MDYDLSIPGWMEEAELQWLHDRASEMDSVVEIGCYQGRSTFALLQGCKGLVYAVDPWFDIMRNGDNNLVRFILNIQSRASRVGLPWPIDLRIVPMRSQDAAPDVLRANMGPVDMVFIDGDHTEESVKQDIDLWLPRTRKLICGHDFGNPDYPGVEKAVREKFGNRVQHPVGLIWSVELRGTVTLSRLVRWLRAGFLLTLWPWR